MAPDPALDAEVRRVDEDRWLASRFAPREVRARLIAIYALNHEIAKTADVVTQPAIGDIRLAWWREAIAEIHAGDPPRPHPVLRAYAPALHETPLPQVAWDMLIEARGADLDAAPFETWADLERYLDATAGSALRLAMAACAVGGAEEAFIRPAAQAWGSLGILRAATHWRARGRNLLPARGGSAVELVEHARAAHAELRQHKFGDLAFPAIGYIALLPGYFRALTRDRAETSLLARQLKLVVASATGKV